MDRTELLRALLGVVAFVAAGAQVTMRYMILHDIAPTLTNGRRRKKEQVMSVAMLILLTGVGIGNLTHLDQRPTTSTVLISIGVLVAAVGNLDIWLWAKEEDANGNGTAEPRERMRR